MQRPKMVFIILAVFIVVGIGWREIVSKWGSSLCAWLARLCYEAPFFIGTIVLLLLWAFYRWLSGVWDPLEIIRGVDKRWSTSKCQFFLWTVVALFCYASFYAKRAGTGLLNPGDFYVPQNLLLAMGLSITTAVAAKGILTSQINSGTVAKEHVGPDEAQTSDLVKDDGGAIDLTKVQMLGWTIIALGAYMTNVVHTVRHIAPNSRLPDIDMALMVLMGLGQGAYLAKKMIVARVPTITSIDPPKSRPGREIKLTGTMFGTTQGGSVIAIDGLIPNPPVLVKSWSDTGITIFLPGPPLPHGWSAGQKAVSVTQDGGIDSNSVRLLLLARGPRITALRANANQLTVTGIDFGPAVGSVRVNDKPPPQIISWTDTGITLVNPDPANIKPGTNVSVKIFLSDDAEPAVESSVPL